VVNLAWESSVVLAGSCDKEVGERRVDACTARTGRERELEMASREENARCCTRFWGTSEAACPD